MLTVGVGSAAVISAVAVGDVVVSVVTMSAPTAGSDTVVDVGLVVPSAKHSVSSLKRASTALILSGLLLHLDVIC